jgi:putative phosphoribosyl transferase
MRIFRNREEAGKSLADELETRVLRTLGTPVVIALPRGGVPVAAEIANRLKAPLDVLITRKIGAPQNPEYGIGAISENGSFWLNDDAIRSLRLSEIETRVLVKKEEQEIRRRIQAYRGDRPLTDVRDRTVILVDDGLATGVTAKASIRALREMGAKRVILAVPVGAPDSVAALSQEADQVVCLEVPAGFYSVGTWYENFEQTSDEEVIRLLSEAQKARRNTDSSKKVTKEIMISDGWVRLPGKLSIPSEAKGIVLFAHGCGSRRHSHRNLQIAENLNEAGIATLLFDLLDPLEALESENVLDIPLLAGRLVLAYTAIRQRPETFELPLAIFGTNTGGAAALWAAAILGDSVASVVSQGGRPHLALEKLSQVRTPTLLIVGGLDEQILSINRDAHDRLRNSKLLIVAGATHLFEEPGALEAASDAAKDWFLQSFEKSTVRTAA